MRILVTGANGFIGQHVVKACMERGYQVTAATRKTSVVKQSNSDYQVIQVDFASDHNIDVWLTRLKGIEVVINCVGIIHQGRHNSFETIQTKAACALFKACEVAGVTKVIQISALGADETASTHFHLTKKSADDFLARLELDWTILRPSIVYGKGAASTALFRALAALPITPLPGNGEQRIQPIGIDDFCRLIVLSIETSRLSRRRIDVVGAEAISLKTLLSLMKTWLGLPHQAFIKIPSRVVSLAIRLLGFANKSPVSADSLKMLNAGSSADMTKLVELAGFQPASISKLIGHSMASMSEIADARQFFLFPLLRIVLALLWIFSGYVSAFVYPIEQSLSMLARLGVYGDYALLFLYMASMIDAVLGFALLVAFHTRIVLALQIAMIIVYTLLISIGVPELWWHPFTPIAKNLPLLVCSLLLFSREKPSWTS